MSISQKAMLAGVAISAWSARKLDRKVTDDTNRAHHAAADAGRYNKALLAPAALADIVAISGRARTEHYARTLPWSDKGPRILLNVGYADFAKIMRGLQGEFDDAADRFCAGYADMVDAARVRLNGMFDPTDYPDAAEIRARFRFKTQIWPMPDAGDFRVELSQGESERIKAEIQAEFDASIQMAMRDVFSRIADVTGKMAESLPAYTPGQRTGVFRDSLVENVRELVALLPSLNITGDATLERIGKRMQAELCRYDPDALRDDAAVRKETADAATSILAEISDFLA